MLSIDIWSMMEKPADLSRVDLNRTIQKIFVSTGHGSMVILQTKYQPTIPKQTRVLHVNIAIVLNAGTEGCMKSYEFDIPTTRRNQRIFDELAELQEEWLRDGMGEEGCSLRRFLLLVTDMLPMAAKE